MFIFPETFEFFKVSAGFVHITGKKAANIAHDTECVEMYNIAQQNLFRPINDITASDLLMGRLFVGCKDPGTSGMHKCELITKQTMGQVTMKSTKQVIDSFPEMEMFRSKIRKLSSSIMDIKQKSKYKRYVKFVETSNCRKEPLKLETPNDTRVTGTMMMYQSRLRSHGDLHYYMQSSDAPQSLKNIYTHI